MTTPSQLREETTEASLRPDEEGWIPTPPVALSDGTQIQLFKDGDGLRAAFEAIQSAKRRICLEVYIFRSDDTGNAFADLLAKKSKEGVAVFVIYDSFGCFDSSASMFHKLKAAGVRLREFHPINPWESQFGWRPLNRDHRKLLFIDDHIAGIGGLNVGQEYAGSSIIHTTKCERWRDSGIGIVGPSARPFFQAFAKTWKHINSGGRIRRMQFEHDVDGGELGVLASVPTINSPLRPFVHQMFRSATRSIDLTMAYFAPDDELIESLCSAARKGVRVRLMLPGKCDIRFLQIAARSFYETLLNRSVQIYEREGVVLHSKTMVIDDAITVMGSTNLDYRSIEYNCEISAIIRNRAFGQHMRALFQHDIRFAKRISLAEWRYRPTRDRIVQWAVSRARYLL
ncbi:MAG: phospholipase D-like domain-containing protein [Planctomycetota bacterium]|nr:phospholipase D-like domain-containing protein [Planctomycetota bacterium]